MKRTPASPTAPALRLWVCPISPPGISCGAVAAPGSFSLLDTSHSVLSGPIRAESSKPNRRPNPVLRADPLTVTRATFSACCQRAPAVARAYQDPFQWNGESVDQTVRTLLQTVDRTNSEN